MQSAAQTEIHKLFHTPGLVIRNIKIFPGTNPNVTAEEVAREVNKSLERLSAGDYELVDINQLD